MTALELLRIAAAGELRVAVSLNDYWLACALETEGLLVHVRSEGTARWTEFVVWTITGKGRVNLAHMEAGGAT